MASALCLHCKYIFSRDRGNNQNDFNCDDDDNVKIERKISNFFNPTTLEGLFELFFPCRNVISVEIHEIKTLLKGP